jgi:alkaline phosphatase D
MTHPLIKQYENLVDALEHGRMDRRTFLRRTGQLAVLLAGLGSVTTGCLSLSQFFEDDLKLSDHPFTLGIASGDPLPDGVVLWTRLAISPLTADGGMPKAAVPVHWEVAEDELFKNVVRKGSETALPDDVHSVHAEVNGLAPDRWYYYRFRAGGFESAVGRTKTAPKVGAAVDRMRFAFISCQNIEHGYYNAYKDMTEQDLDLIVHLGDYIYDGKIAKDSVRPLPQATTEMRGDLANLAQYRLRYSLYKMDGQLQAAHAAFPWLVTLDDHEVDGNSWSEGSKAVHDKAKFLLLRAAGLRAYWEHMPLRKPQKPNGIDMLLYRRLAFGELAEFHVLDTRQYRDEQTTCEGEARNGGYCKTAIDPGRTIMGSEQRKWLMDGLGRSKAHWNVMAQQVIFSQTDYADGNDAPDYVGIGDKWDGYEADRKAVLDLVQQRKMDNLVVLTGDSHTNRVYDVKANFADPLSATLATEFCGTSISTQGSSQGTKSKFKTQYREPREPHQKFFDNHRGYVRCELTKDVWTSEYRVANSITTPGLPLHKLAAFAVENGKPGAERV